MPTGSVGWLHPRKIICERCGVETYAAGRAKYCVDCKDEVLRERDRERQKRRYLEKLSFA